MGINSVFRLGLNVNVIVSMIFDGMHGLMCFIHGTVLEDLALSRWEVI